DRDTGALLRLVAGELGAEADLAGARRDVDVGRSGVVVARPRLDLVAAGLQRDRRAGGDDAAVDGRLAAGEGDLDRDRTVERFVDGAVLAGGEVELAGPRAAHAGLLADDGVVAGVELDGGGARGAAVREVVDLDVAPGADADGESRGGRRRS